MGEVRRGKNLIDTSLFYDFGPVLSHNAVYNFIVGGRGIGKTYGSKKYVIGNYLKNGAQFLYVRRYNTELKTRDTFFNDIAHEFPGYGFRVRGRLMEITANPEDKKPEWQTMGYFVALSTAQSLKSVSYFDVTTIIFDEFIIEKGNLQYLPDEAVVFNNLYSTVDRYQDKTRVLFLANAVSIMNPYFIDYNIVPKPGKPFKMARGFIACHFPNDAGFAAAVKESRFGQFIAGTSYEDYSVGNEFRDNSDNMIAPKPSDSAYLCSMITSRGSFSVWQKSGMFYVQAKRPGQENLYCVEPELVTPDVHLLNFTDPITSALRTAYRWGRLCFDRPSTREAFIILFKRR